MFVECGHKTIIYINRSNFILLKQLDGDVTTASTKMFLPDKNNSREYSNELPLIIPVARLLRLPALALMSAAKRRPRAAPAAAASPAPPPRSPPPSQQQQSP